METLLVNESAEGSEFMSVSLQRMTLGSVAKIPSVRVEVVDISTCGKPIYVTVLLDIRYITKTSTW